MDEKEIVVEGTLLFKKILSPFILAKLPRFNEAKQLPKINKEVNEKKTLKSTDVRTQRIYVKVAQKVTFFAVTCRGHRHECCILYLLENSKERFYRGISPN